MKLLSCITLPFLALSITSGAENPIEAGKVKWGRDLDAALAASEETGKPLFVLFQEVPG